MLLTNGSAERVAKSGADGCDPAGFHSDGRHDDCTSDRGERGEPRLEPHDDAMPLLLLTA